MTDVKAQGTKTGAESQDMKRPHALRLFRSLVERLRDWCKFSRISFPMKLVPRMAMRLIFENFRQYGSTYSK